MSKRIKSSEEWLKQANHDIETAQDLYKVKKYIPCIFFCHLSIEKALKGLYVKRYEKEPVRTHNLHYFIENTGLKPDKTTEDFITELNRLSIPTRYPEDLGKMYKKLNKEKTLEILNNSEAVLQWLKKN